MTSKELGARLKQLREAASLSRADLARAMYVAHTTVSRIEDGERLPPVDTIEAWAGACGRGLKIEFPPLPSPADVEAFTSFGGLRREMVALGLQVAVLLHERVHFNFIAAGIGESRGDQHGFSFTTTGVEACHHPSAGAELEEQYRRWSAMLASLDSREASLVMAATQLADRLAALRSDCPSLPDKPVDGARPPKSDPTEELAFLTERALSHYLRANEDLIIIRDTMIGGPPAEDPGLGMWHECLDRSRKAARALNDSAADFARRCFDLAGLWRGDAGFVKELPRLLPYRQTKQRIGETLYAAEDESHDAEGALARAPDDPAARTLYPRTPRPVTSRTLLAVRSVPADP